MKKMKMLAAMALALLLPVGMLPANALPVRAEESLPEAFDLRSRGVVTSVKSQDPWGTCWAFSSCAASEISLLSEMGMTAEQFKEKYGEELNLSEKHLGWWSYHAVPKNSGEGRTQAGEGVYVLGENLKSRIKRNISFVIGGTPIGAATLYSSGIGPIIERGIYRYRGFDENGRPSFKYSADWTLPNRTYNYFDFELTDGNQLPLPAKLKLNEKKQCYIYKGYDEAGTEAIKRELYEGRGVSIAYKADISQPEELENGQVRSKFMSEHWAQYYDKKEIMPNHGVCIIGWDDNYAVSNFNAAHRPPAAGAWLVKNSWGTQDTAQKSHNYAKDGWGIVDDEGRNTGYFWLSYYDHSISMAESFVFSLDRDADEMIVGQYDLLQGGKDDMTAYYQAGKRKQQMANVYEAPKNIRLRSVGVDTYADNTTVRFDVYRTKPDYRNPTQGRRIASKTVKFPYKGYHRVDLKGKNLIKKGDFYSVVVTQTVRTKNGVKYVSAAPLGMSEKLAKMIGSPFYCKAVVNYGESFYGEQQKNGRYKWVDWAEHIEKEKAKYREIRLVEIDNFAIKAFSDPAK